MLKLQQIKDKITGEIHNVNNADFIKLLYKKYVECENLWSIAKNMGYSYDRIRHMHGEALKEFDKKNEVSTK